uniref:Uncharacterized protein n=1 Tax=Romanomermis culicivorax TaxID=13658 RepID=A0A915JP07_ROMCU
MERIPNFHSYNDERPQHVEMYNNYMEDYGTQFSLCWSAYCVLVFTKKCGDTCRIITLMI